MNSVLFTPFTKLLELEFTLNFLLIFARPVIGPFANLARQFY